METKSQKKRPPCRLFLIMARQSATAVIFRRGPSKWTQLIQWNTKTDTLEYGQWFKGRIYEKRCDLSPDGNLLIYFASKFNKKTITDNEYTYAWTAISKPPWLTALALWPKGDCWHGGGLFENNKSVLLNHRPEVVRSHPEHLPPRWMRIVANSEASGEDEPIYSQRLTRDGWEVSQNWQVEYTKSRQGFVTHQPEIRIIRHPKRSLDLLMKRHLNDFKYYEMYEVKDLISGKTINLDNAECARWDHRGRLVFTNGGKLYASYVTEEAELVTNEVAGFNHLEPEEVESPSWAKQW